MLQSQVAAAWLLVPLLPRALLLQPLRPPPVSINPLSHPLSAAFSPLVPKVSLIRLSQQVWLLPLALPLLLCHRWLLLPHRLCHQSLHRWLQLLQHLPQAVPVRQLQPPVLSLLVKVLEHLVGRQNLASRRQGRRVGCIGVGEVGSKTRRRWDGKSTECYIGNRLNQKLVLTDRVPGACLSFSVGRHCVSGSSTF